MLRHSVLGIRSEHDLLLHHIGPIGLAACQETALLVDLDAASPAYPGRLTISDLLNDGVRRSDLGPMGRGVAVLNHGGADHGESLDLIAALSSGWPAIVVRVGVDPIPYPVVHAVPEFPADWAGGPDAHVVQPVTRWTGGRSGAIRLPALRGAQVTAMLAGHVMRRWRWVQAWSAVWELAWD